MKMNIKLLLSFFLIMLFVITNSLLAQTKANKNSLPNIASNKGFLDLVDLGFSPTATGINNVKVLQAALDKGGTIIVSKPGKYKVSGTAYIGDNTSLVFGNGVILEKSDENGRFTHVFLNKGALTRTYNYNITITGLNLNVNGVDKPIDMIYGLRGHVAFFYVKDLKIERFRISGLINGQFAVHVCTFEDLLIDDGIIKGKKDGIHLGGGKRFKISNCVFQTGDDAIALVPGDWVSANPEFGNLEDGIIENCSDIPDDYLEGGFAKIVASAWIDWHPNIEVKHGDAVVSNGKIYRVVANLDNKVYKSVTQPTFDKGMAVLDSINWLMFQTDTIHTAVVRNVIFRDINLHSVRVPFQLMSYSNKWAHSYYPGARHPIQGDITLDNVNVLSPHKRALISITTPCDIITIKNSTLKANSIDFGHAKDYDKYPDTHINISNCVFKSAGNLTLINNNSPRKEIYLKTSGNISIEKDFSASVNQGAGKIHVDSDLKGLKNNP